MQVNIVCLRHLQIVQLNIDGRYIVFQILGAFIAALLVYVQWNVNIKVRPSCLSLFFLFTCATGSRSSPCRSREVRRRELHAARSRWHLRALRPRGLEARPGLPQRICLRMCPAPIIPHAVRRLTPKTNTGLLDRSCHLELHGPDQLPGPACRRPMDRLFLIVRSIRLYPSSIFR